MVVHICIRCKKEFHKKSHYVCHTSRKIPCKEKIIIPPKPVIINISSSEITCIYCKKTFKRKDNLKIHIDSRCKVKKEKDEKEKNDNILLQKIFELEEKINILESTKTNIIVTSV